MDWFADATHSLLVICAEVRRSSAVSHQLDDVSTSHGGRRLYVKLVDVVLGSRRRQQKSVDVGYVAVTTGCSVAQTRITR